MKLNTNLTNTFKYNGNTYSINLSFDRVLDVIDVQQDDTVLIDDKAVLMLKILGIDIKEDDNVFLLIKHVFENLIMDDDEETVEYDVLGNPLPKRKNEDRKRTIDFVKDAEYIYAGFRQAYGINLFNEFGKLHWFEFKALLNALPEDTLMYQIRNIRGWKPSKGDSAEYKKQMYKLQQSYSLDD